VLARQLILERARLSIPKALERIGGLQAQYAPAMYVGLWSRLEGLERDAVTRALERRSVVQATMMRATIHLVSKADYWPLTVAIREPRRRWWDRVHPAIDPREMRAAARTLRRFLADGPRRRKEIEDLLGREIAQGIGMYVDLVRAPPSGTWAKRRADLFALAEDWVGPPEIGADEALEHMIRRYLGAFGPATRTDIAQWAGIDVKDIAKGLDRMTLRRFRDEAGKELVDLPRATIPGQDATAPPRLLPVWDALLLVHARRTGVLPEAYRPRIFSAATPQSVNTFLLDGRVAGTWRHENCGIDLAPFERVARTDRRALNDEAERLARFNAV
jgi:hypothetical protein